MTTSLHRSANRLAHVLTLSAAIAVAAASALVAQNVQGNQPVQYRTLSADELDSIVAPVALYADPLLAQVMLAATYPQQIDDATKWVRANGTGNVDTQPWDVSVKAIAHYPAVLNLLDSNLEWTGWLGAAYANQSTDLMDAVQHMRAAAQANGNLQTNPQQEVTTTDGNISVVPAQPQAIYVPTYDPADVYYDSCLDVFCQPAVMFSVGYPIGPWLMYDWNWPGRQIYYTGWMGGGWIARSRPFIGFNAVYMNDRFRAVPFNHAVAPFVAGRAGFGRTEAGMAGRVAARPFVNSAGARPFVNRAPLITARSASVPTYRGSSYGSSGAAAYRSAQPSREAYSAPREQSRAEYSAPREPSRATYSAPREQAPARSYAAPRQAAPQRQASAPSRGGSSGGRSASRSGRGR